MIFELERNEDEPEVPEKTRQTFQMQVYWMHTGMSMAEKNLQLDNMIHTNNMLGLKGCIYSLNYDYYVIIGGD